MHYPATKLWEVHNALGDGLAYVPYVLSTAADEYPSVVDFLDEIDHRFTTPPKLWICLDRTMLTTPQLAKLIAWRKRHQLPREPGRVI